jgi:NDP-sugar pyrophosphorylase family protein
MGTGGAVTWACSETELPDEILIANGDTWVPGGVAALRNEAANCLASVRVPNSSRYGRLIVDNGLVVGFLEKESTGEEGLISAGIYRLETRYFRAQPLGSPFSLERTILKDLTVSAQLGCALCPGDFIDIGIPEDYQKFSMQIEGRLTSERGS